MSANQWAICRRKNIHKWICQTKHILLERFIYKISNFFVFLSFEFVVVFSRMENEQKIYTYVNGIILFEDFKMEISEMNKFNEKQTATREMRYGKMALYWTTITKCSYRRYIFIRTYFLWSFMKYVNSKNVAS